MRRRDFIALGAAGLASGVTGASAGRDGVRWRDVSAWGVEGRGWDDTTRFYDRLPARAEKTVRPPVWGLSRHSAGMLARFETDAAEIRIRYTLRSPRLALPHMPATGVSGVDLYGRDGEGKDRWLAVVKPTAKSMDVVLASGIDPRPDGGPRRYTIYLPLYNGVDSVEVGVDPAAAFTAVAPRKAKPIVFYGTSIMQGACASRPGMALGSILGRRLDRPVINLGFSGNGKMEAAVTDLMAELDAAVYAIDCLPNMKAAEVSERTGPLVRRLRRDRPETPIVLVEDRSNTSARFLKSRRAWHDANRRALKAEFEKLRDAGVKGLHYLAGERLLGSDGDAATDGSHPSDLGMARYADAYEPVLRKALA